MFLLFLLRNNHYNYAYNWDDMAMHSLLQLSQIFCPKWKIKAYRSPKLLLSIALQNIHLLRNSHPSVLYASLWLHRFHFYYVVAMAQLELPWPSYKLLLHNCILVPDCILVRHILISPCLPGYMALMVENINVTIFWIIWILYIFLISICNQIDLDIGLDIIHIAWTGKWNPKVG